jgi:hypothetical protein
MTHSDTKLNRGIDIATAFIQRELYKRRCLNPNFSSTDIWAGLTHDGRIFIGTPLLQRGQGYYVDYLGGSRQA